MLNITNFINFLKFFLFGRGIICASLLIVFLISSIIYLFYIDIKVGCKGVICTQNLGHKIGGAVFL